MIKRMVEKLAEIAIMIAEWSFLVIVAILYGGVFIITPLIVVAAVAKWAWNFLFT